MTFEPATLHPTEIFDLNPAAGAAGRWDEIGPRIWFRLTGSTPLTMELDGEDVFDEHLCFSRGPSPPCGVESADLPAGLHTFRVAYVLGDEVVVRRVEWSFTVTP